MDQIRAQILYAQLNDENDDNFGDDFNRHNITVTLPPEGYGKRSVLTAMMAPYSYTYFAVIRTLSKLTIHGLIESDFVKECIQEITKQVKDGRCKYGGYLGIFRFCLSEFNLFILMPFHITEESISTDTIRNCMKMLEKRGYIQITHVNGIRVVTLHEKWDSDKGVQEITQQIESIVIAIE